MYVHSFIHSFIHSHSDFQYRNNRIIIKNNNRIIIKNDPYVLINFLIKIPYKISKLTVNDDIKKVILHAGIF